MKPLAFAGALMCSLLVATALTPVRAADMTHERALNAEQGAAQLAASSRQL